MTNYKKKYLKYKLKYLNLKKKLSGGGSIVPISLETYWECNESDQSKLDNLKEQEDKIISNINDLNQIFKNKENNDIEIDERILEEEKKILNIRKEITNLKNSNKVKNYIR